MRIQVEEGAVWLEYSLHGHGPIKVFFVHGFATTVSSWRFQTEFFGNDHAHEYQICVMDNRGMGKSDVASGLYTTTRMAQDCLELLDHLGAQDPAWRKFHLVGLSMGGMISQELSLLCTERLLSLTLCVTHAGGVYAVPPAYAFMGGLQTLIGSKRQEANAYLNMQYSTRYLDSMLGGIPMREHLIQQFLAERETEGAPNLLGLIGQLSAVARHYISRKRLRALKRQLDSQGAPILLLTGTEDHLVRPLNSFILKEILDARLIVFSGCGHMINLEKPELFNQLLYQHFQSAGKPAAKL